MKENLEKLKKEKERLLKLKQDLSNQNNSKKLKIKFPTKKPNLNIIKKKPIKKEKKESKKTKKKSFYQQKKFFSTHIQKAGYSSEFSMINKKIMLVSAILVLISTIYTIIQMFQNHTFIMDAVGFLVPFIILGYAIVFLLIWVSYFIFIDFKIYQRKKEIEEVFPDFLQLTAANISAGMPIDQSLWYAIRPRFGILAKEMEDVAKATMVGQKLDVALIAFSNKYDSIKIKRALSLLIEGLKSGGEVGELLNKVANNMTETELIKKEMASNVTTYIIFILFATLGAAPFLFALTTELIVIMNSIFSNLNTGNVPSSMGGFGGFMSGSAEAISIGDYQIFAIVSIVLAAIFAALITSVIQKGNIKESLKQIPLYIIIGVVNYLISFNLLKMFLGGFFS